MIKPHYAAQILHWKKKWKTNGKFSFKVCSTAEFTDVKMIVIDTSICQTIINLISSSIRYLNDMSVGSGDLLQLKSGTYYDQLLFMVVVV